MPRRPRPDHIVSARNFASSSRLKGVARRHSSSAVSWDPYSWITAVALTECAEKRRSANGMWRREYPSLA